MALEQAYVTTYWKNGKAQISPVIHQQVRCSRLSGKTDIVVVASVGMEGTKIFATWRHYTRQVRWCESCPTEPFKWEWQDDAKCSGTWPAVDMLAFEQGKHHAPARLIAEYCERCPVRQECAEFACQDLTGLVGIWGGVFIPPTNKHRPAAIAKLKAVARGTLPNSEHAA